MGHDGRVYIGGEWTAPAAGGSIDVISPHTEGVIDRAPAAGPRDVDRAVAGARAAVDEGPWPRLDPSQRIDAVRRLAAIYGERRREMAELVTAVMGAPITFSKLAQATLPCTMLSAFADVAVSHRWEEVRPGYCGRATTGQDVTLRNEPVGVVAVDRSARRPPAAGADPRLRRAGPEGRRPARRRRRRPSRRHRPGPVRASHAVPRRRQRHAHRPREILGPVLTVIPYRDEDEALRLANESDYGLSGSVWTADADRGLAVSRRVRTGTFGVNQPYSMDPGAPFGGVKASGFGRELGREGLDEFLDVTAISVAPAP